MSNIGDMSIGDRMKDFYENCSKTVLMRKSPVIIRIDGCHFHSYTKGLKKPFDDIFIEAMQETTKELCKSIQGCKIGYVESDEISLLLTDYDTRNTDAWFGYAVQKICSVAAALATMYFNKCFAKAVDHFERSLDKSNLSQEDFDYLNLLYRKKELGGYFDARAFNIPETEIVNYFIWRQQDSSRNSIAGLGRAYFSQNRLLGLSGNQIQDLLHEECNINWNDLATVKKRGSCIISTDSGWIIDTEIPIFTKDRNYIERFLPERD